MKCYRINLISPDFFSSGDRSLHSRRLFRFLSSGALPKKALAHYVHPVLFSSMAFQASLTPWNKKNLHFRARFLLVAGVGFPKGLSVWKSDIDLSAFLQYLVILSASNTFLWVLQTKITSTITGFNLIIDYTIEPLARRSQISNLGLVQDWVSVVQFLINQDQIAYESTYVIMDI